MNPIFEIVMNMAKSLISPVVAGLICGFFVMRQARRNLHNREFLDRLNVSLNILKGGRLKIRTLIEKPCVEVFLNPVITKMVNKAATRTTEEDCLLPIKNPDDYWLCLNALLNEVSEKFADGFVRMDINASVPSETYVMALTCEVASNIKTRKLRAMLIKKSVLVNFPAVDPAVDFESHSTRIVTLRQLARDFNDPAKKHCFVEFELCV